MPKSAPVVQRQTIKQAKAAFKARGRPSLSEAEKKQLERSLELERRAWRSKEQDKRKAEVVRKRQEKERLLKEEQQRDMLGTQRRCDRFGYKSSQFHLGAFFGAGAVKKEEQQASGKVEADEAFGDDEVDDQTLLDALDSPDHTATRPPHPQSDNVLPSASQWSGVAVQRSKTEPPHPNTEDELGNFWDELGSSTQIARELAPETRPAQQSKPEVRTGSFNSGDFDLSAEDLEELEPPKPAVSKAETDRKLMPPPALPVKVRTVPTKIFKPYTLSRSPMAAPALTGPPIHRASYAGFTMTELEGFVDDDLQLTQIAPG